MVKICLNGKPWGYNGSYNNPEYVQKQRIAQHKRYGTINDLDITKSPNKNRYHKGSGKTRMTQEEYLKSDKNPLNNPKYQFKKGILFGIKKREIYTQRILSKK